MSGSTKQNTAKHTPRLWIAKDDDIYDHSGVLVARAFTYPDTISFGERNANAALIAAAPELLSALKAALQWIDRVPASVKLPAMPGFDRDWVDGVVAKAEAS